MGNSNGSSTSRPTTSSTRPRERRTDTSSQYAFVSSSPPYPGSSSSESRNASRSSYPSSTYISDDYPRNVFRSTSESSYNAGPSSSGARPKENRATSSYMYGSGTSQQSSAVPYPGTNRTNVTFPTQKKQLYMASSLSRLRERIDQGIDWSNATRLADKAVIAILTANKAYQEKDEEKAYILYERYARMWAHIRESQDYKNMPITFDNILGPTNIGTAFDRIDELKLSLKSRYRNHTPAVGASQVPGATVAQTPVPAPRITTSAVRKPQRQTFQPLETSSMTSSSGIRSSGSTPTQTSSGIRNSGLTTTQTSSNTRSSGLTPTQTSSNTRSSGLTPSQILSNTRSSGSTPTQTSSNTRSSGSTPSQTSSNTRSSGSTPSQTGRSSAGDLNQVTGTGGQQHTSAAKKGLHAGVVDEMRENLLCPICYELFENAKNLPCGHVICERCIGQWVASKGGSLSCPTCKAGHTLPSNGVAGLPTNFLLNNLVAELKKLDEEEVDNEVESKEEQLPIVATTSLLMEELPPSVSTIPSLLDVETSQPPSSPGAPSAETSFMEKSSRKSNRDAKGSTVRLRVQLCDSEGTRMRGRRCDEVEAVVVSPSGEREDVSVTLMKRDGDYTFSFTPNKVGVHQVEAFLDGDAVRNSPLKVIVRPSAQLVRGIPFFEKLKDIVAYDSMIHVTDDCAESFFSTHVEYPEECYPEDKSDEVVDSFGIDLSNDKFFITFSNKSCVKVYDSSGVYMNNFGKRVLESPTGIAVSSGGMIYVADSQTNTIDVFRPNFSHAHSITAGGNADRCSLALLALNPSEDRLIAADQKQDCFKIFDVVNKKMVKMIKTRVQQAPARPFGVAVDEDGSIFVSATFDPSKLSKGGGKSEQKGKNRKGVIIVYNSDGYFLGTFGESELKNPRGLDFCDDKVVVADHASLLVYQM